jgi:hypothetical protein
MLYICSVTLYDVNMTYDDSSSPTGFAEELLVELDNAKAMRREVSEWTTPDRDTTLSVIDEGIEFIKQELRSERARFIRINLNGMPGRNRRITLINVINEVV